MYRRKRLDRFVEGLTGGRPKGFLVAGAAKSAGTTRRRIGRVEMFNVRKFIERIFPVQPIVIQTYDGNGSEASPWRDRVAHGELDTVESHMLYLRLEIAKHVHFTANEICVRCKAVWGLAKDHATWGVDTGRGCTALCEDCWLELHTPENRMPYYRRNWERYWQSEPWEKFEAAVNLEAKLNRSE